MENILEYNKWEDKLWALYNSIFKDASYTIKEHATYIVQFIKFRIKN